MDPVEELLVPAQLLVSGLRVKVGLTNSVENRSGDETIGISMIPFGELEAFSKWRTYWFVISMMTS